MKEYRLQYLNDKEFEALSRINPRYANTADDAGFADMVTNRIFVRKSGDTVIDQFVTNHEIEEILAKNSAHEDEYKIRHKKGKNTFARIIPVVAGILAAPLGPWASAAAAAGARALTATQMQDNPPRGGALAADIGLSGVGGYLGGSAMAPGVAASKAATTAAGASPSYVGQVLTGAQQALGFQSGAQRTLASSAIAPSITAPTMAQGFAANQAAIPGATTPVSFGGANYAISSGAKGLTAAALPATAALGFQGASMPTATPPPQPSVSLGQGATDKLQFQPQPEVGANFGGKINTLPGAGLPASLPATGAQAGAAGGGGALGGGGAATKPSILSNLLGDNWRQTLIGASIPLLGQSVGSMFGATPTPEPFTPEQSALFQETAQMVRQGANVQLNPGQKQAITANYDDALQQARQNLMDRYKQLRPGSDIENDSQFRGAMIELESDFAEKRANALAAAQLGLSTQQTQMMSELANMEVGLLSQKAGISYQEASDFRNMLSSLGFMVAQSGQPIIYTSR